MPYPFPEFMRHLDGWQHAAMLTRVCPMPEENGEWVEVGDRRDNTAQTYRLMHMLHEMGYPPAQRVYFTRRFAAIGNYIWQHGDQLAAAGLVTRRADGELDISIPCYLATIRYFEQDPMPDPDTVDLASIVRFGKEIQAARRELRHKILTTKPSDLSIAPNAEFPDIYGVVLDFHNNDQVISAVALANGFCNIYPAAPHGILKEQIYPVLKPAATGFIGYVAPLFDDSKPTTDFTLPDPDVIKFYLLTYDGVRVVEGQRKAVEAFEGKYKVAFGGAQYVIGKILEVGQQEKTQAQKPAGPPAP